MSKETVSQEMWFISLHLFCRCWTFFLLFFSTPFLVHRLGLDAFALTGIFVLLRSFSGPLETAFGLVCNKHASQGRAAPEGDLASKTMLYTVDRLCFWGGLTLGLLLVVSGWHGAHWLWPLLDGKVIGTVVVAAMATIPIQIPASCYSQTLLALERHSVVIAITILCDTLRHLGFFLLLFWWPATAALFCFWHMGIFLLQTLAFRVALCLIFSASLPPAAWSKQKAKSLLLEIGKTGWISLLDLVLLQIDGLWLSAASLTLYAYYSISFKVVNFLLFILIPLFAVFFPKICQAVGEGNKPLWSEVYWRMSRIFAILIVPLGALLSFFSHPMLLIWLEDAALVEQAVLPLPYLVIGCVFHGLIQAPLALLLALGKYWQLALYQILVLLVVVAILPPLFFYFSLEGIAVPWVLYNGGFLFILAPWVHKHYLIDIGYWRWFFDIVGKPLLASVPGLCYRFWMGGYDPVWLLAHKQRFILEMLVLYILMTLLGAFLFFLERLKAKQKKMIPNVAVG